MSWAVIQIILSIAVFFVKWGITCFFKAKLLVRPNIRDKEAVRVYLDNIFRWAGYLCNLFFKTEYTVAYFIGVLIYLVQPGPFWDQFYQALLLDADIDPQFTPAWREPQKKRRLRDQILMQLASLLKRQDYTSAPSEVQREVYSEIDAYLTAAAHVLQIERVSRNTQATYQFLQQYNQTK